MSLLSKLVSPELAKGTFNSGMHERYSTVQRNTMQFSVVQYDVTQRIVTQYSGAT